MARITQAMRPHERGRLQKYLDDPMLTLAGPQAEKARAIAKVVLLWRAFGFRLSWKKCARGDGLVWIGLSYTTEHKRQVVIIEIPRKQVEELCELARDALKQSMIPFKKLRKLAGKAAWISSVVPSARWTTSRLYAALASEEQRLASPKVGKKGGSRFALVARCQVELALRWLIELWSGQTSLRRIFRRELPPAKFEFLFDASPWGLGGVLVHTATGQPLQFFAEAVQPEDEVRLQLSVGSSAGQAKLETLAIVLGMRVWAPLLRECGA